MTDRVEPSPDRDARARWIAAYVQRAGGSDEGWIVPSGEDPGNLAEDELDIDESALDAFDAITDANDLDVTIEPGQAYVGGAWLARDLESTVTLDASTSDQEVYVGWDVDASNSVIVGTDSDFGDDDPKHLIWTFDTDSDGVSAATDDRNLDDYRVRNVDVEFTQDLDSGDTVTDYPFKQADLAEDSVGNDELRDDSVGTGEIQENAVERDQIGDEAVGSDQIEKSDIQVENFATGGGQREVPVAQGDGTIQMEITPEQSPIYGHGPEGDIVRTSGGTDDGIIMCERYEVESGVTRTVSNGVLIVFANDEILIDGTIDASGTGGQGGAGGDGGGENEDGDPGEAGALADFVGVFGEGGDGGEDGDLNDQGDDGENGGGGGGGSRDFNDGGDGGNSPGKDATDSERERVGVLHSDTWQDRLYDLSSMAGVGGGGGGGGGAGSGDIGGDGGDGGDGGGLVVFVAPDIAIPGTVDVSGEAGGEGGGPPEGQGAGGGGGGGGSAGVIGLFSPSIEDSGATYDLSGGVGGDGWDDALGRAGGDGGDGEDGLKIEVEL